jgi:Chaperone of endosialidase
MVNLPGATLKTEKNMKLQNLIHILIGIVCIGLLPNAQGVVPAPDGGYPGFNTAEGQNALFNLTTGSANTAVGWFSLFSNTDGSNNTAVGAGTLLFNVGNPPTGAGISNTAIGTAALLFNTTGGFNTAVGVSALLNNANGSSNTAVGGDALHDNTDGLVNTAVGGSALHSNTTGGGNTAVGALALENNTTGSNNIALGVFAGMDVTTANNVICIGTNVFGADVNDSCYIGNIAGATAVLGTAVFISADNKLGTITSSKRFKEDIKPIGIASEALYALDPVTFRYRKEIDPAGTSQLGLVAEEVEKVNPDLVVRDKEGKPYSVRYDQVNAMLLNEFLKEHRAFVEEQRKVEQQQKEIDALRAELKAQRSLIQRVSDQVKLKNSTAQVVVDNQ